MIMRFRILGPLEIWTGEEWVSLNAPKWRIVLATLLLQPRQMVPAAALVDELWPGDPPSGARKLVSLYVMRVRRILGDGEGRMLVTRPPGYQLLVERDDVDARRFDDLKRRGRQALADRRPGPAAAMLAEALGLWRGPSLGDVPRAPLVTVAASQLDESRLEAVELSGEASLACGRHRELVAGLRRLVDEHPLRESFRSQLMLALYRCGRQTEALACYQQARRALIDQAGLEPGPGLTRLHGQILRSDPSLLPAEHGHPARPSPAPLQVPEPRREPEPFQVPAPRQLPPGAACFAGRRAELAALTGLREKAGALPPGGTPIAAITGTAGVGKTALAIRWAHEAARDFPDGQLYVNLRGYHPSGAPVPPDEAIRGFLGALQPAGQIPVPPQARADLFRSLMAGRRMLVLLDNARDSGQVRPLLPGTPGCMVLVTSRSQLIGLVAAEGACPLPVGLPTAADARALLAARLGTQRCMAEPAAVTELVQLCGCLPLALSIACAQAACQPHLVLDVLVARLREARLDALGSKEEPGGLRAAFSSSYRQLGPGAARMFRSLAAHPGPDISARAAAILAGLPFRQAGEALAELTGASLLDQPGPNRFALHPLLRAYAAELAYPLACSVNRR